MRFSLVLGSPRKKIMLFYKLNSQKLKLFGIKKTLKYNQSKDLNLL